MIKFIAAIDTKLGMADDRGIPWQGRIPIDVAYFRSKTLGGNILMGYTTYLEFDNALPDRRNLVASSKQLPLKPGFELISDARGYLTNVDEDIWVIGGPGLFVATFDLADELYLTRIDGDFNCTKFFPKFTNRFKLLSKSKHFNENGINFTFEVWVVK